MTSSATPYRIFASLQYVISPPLKMAEAPSVSVMSEATVPDVQLSIVAIDLFCPIRVVVTAAYFLRISFSSIDASITSSAFKS
jgi:hypothetical protein